MEILFRWYCLWPWHQLRQLLGFSSHLPLQMWMNVRKFLLFLLKNIIKLYKYRITIWIRAKSFYKISYKICFSHAFPSLEAITFNPFDLWLLPVYFCVSNKMLCCNFLLLFRPYLLIPPYERHSSHIPVLFSSPTSQSSQISTLVKSELVFIMIT